MALPLGPLVAALLLGAPPTRVEDPTACLSAEAVAGEIDALLPAGPGPDAPLSLEITLAPRADDPLARPVRVVLKQTTGGAVLLDRELHLALADCSEAPALVARIVVRRLQALPREAWEPWRPPPPPRPPRWAVAIDLGAGLGLDRREVRGVLATRALAPLGASWALSFGLAAALTEPFPVGTGRARLVAAAALGGLAWRQERAGFALGVEGGVALGARVARGLGFDRAETALLPGLDAHVDLVLASPWLVHARVGLVAPLLAARLREEGGAEATREPALRLEATLGVTFEP